MTTSLIVKSEVHEGEYDTSPVMLYVGYNIKVADLIAKYEYLKENFGLTMLRLAYSLGFSETTVGKALVVNILPTGQHLLLLPLGLTNGKSSLRVSKFSEHHKNCSNIVRDCYCMTVPDVKKEFGVSEQQ